MSFHRLTEAWYCPWYPTTAVVAAEVEYIGPWPDGGTGICVRRFPAGTVAESNQQARTFMLALELGNGRVPADRGDFWEIAA